MRVLHVMAGAEEGGAENIMLESVLALAAAGHEQHVVTRPENTFRIEQFTSAGITADTAAPSGGEILKGPDGRPISVQTTGMGCPSAGIG